MTLFGTFGNFLVIYFLFFALIVTFLALFEEEKKNHVSHVLSHMSHVACHISQVTFHLSLMSTATDLPPADSIIIHSRLVPAKKNKKKQTY